MFWTKKAGVSAVRATDRDQLEWKNVNALRRLAKGQINVNAPSDTLVIFPQDSSSDGLDRFLALPAVEYRTSAKVVTQS